ncbi:MAG: hypothetical protein J5562_06180 [Clostridia bacterium]|nr:hypothetical protein [Clostridia bacterium]
MGFFDGSGTDPHGSDSAREHDAFIESQREFEIYMEYERQRKEEENRNRNNNNSNL